MPVFWMIPPGMPEEKKFQVPVYARGKIPNLNNMCSYERYTSPTPTPNS